MNNGNTLYICSHLNRSHVKNTLENLHNTEIECVVRLVPYEQTLHYVLN